MELGWPLPKRKKFLRELVAERSDKTHPVPFQGRMQYMRVHSVPLGLPLYRLENGRTTGLQAEYIAAHPGTPDDFFRADTELETAQKAQHNILVKLASGSKNLFKEFEKHPQAEPIILSSLGYVVNGNRRLSTWRTLYNTESRKYKQFHTIEAVILPHTDDKELDRLEAELQLKEDLKADYSWTARGLMLKEKIDRFKYTEDEIASIYGMKKKDVKELFDCIEYGEEYLEIRNKPKKFSELDDKEFAFRQISRTRSKIKYSEADRELFERSAFCLADEAGEGTRIYAEIPKIADHIAEVRENLLSELDIDVARLSQDDISVRLVEALEDERNFEKARLAIRDTIEAEAAKKKNRKRQDFVATQVERARLNLFEAANAIERNSTRNGVADALKQIEAHVETLRDWVTQDDE